MSAKPAAILVAMKLPFALVDAFAERPGEGNPAGVVLVRGALDDSQMRLIASEFNQAETAFVSGEGAIRGLRWFTPTVEVDLCGHATLASAHRLWELEEVHPKQPITFESRSGPLRCYRDEGMTQLSFPQEVVTPSQPTVDTTSFPQAQFWGANRMDWFVEFADEDAVRSFQPDFREIAALGRRGLIVTAKASSEGFDFVSRFFGPQSGVPEDHVTGSAHCALAPYWGQKLEKAVLVGRQLSPRGGTVRCELQDDRVLLGGRARTFATGELTL
jgi:predicted PhzF superfamily epimerase YddE/YHI9